MTQLTAQKEKLEELISGANLFNAKSKIDEIEKLLEKYIPAVDQMHTTLKKYNVAFTTTTSENKKLKKKNEQLEKPSKESVLKKLEDEKLRHQYLDAVSVLERIPPEVVRSYTRMPVNRNEKSHEESI